MSAFLTNNNQLQHTAMAEDPEKQGIVSILCSDSARATSLRRTLSADMSSQKWLSPMKRTASSDELSHQVNAGQLDTWSSIVSQNANHDCSAPYVHPLVKRFATSLSNNSLELCTESLGSETGSDGFSADLQNVHVVKYNFTPAGKKAPPASFPPPLPSRGDGPSLRVKPRRENGRLVLEAVSVAVDNNFKAKRHDGRLVLTLLKEGETDQLHEQLREENIGEYEDENGAIEMVTRKEPKSSGGVIELHRLAMMVNKPAGLAIQNPTWAHKFNHVAKFDELKKSLPPRPLAGACWKTLPPTASFNSYDYCWRVKPVATYVVKRSVIVNL